MWECPVLKIFSPLKFFLTIIYFAVLYLLNSQTLGIYASDFKTQLLLHFLQLLKVLLIFKVFFKQRTKISLVFLILVTELQQIPIIHDLNYLSPISYCDKILWGLYIPFKACEKKTVSLRFPWTTKLVLQSV